ncbi:MAG: ribonuclease H-like domain-containing protein [Candidatus Thermoplasmatota archaeon]|jgi:hypothetical protein|nr:ribonuclease H-like domain-containing protein [Candidatus Thermoplasmatota archaeon]
MTRRAFIDIETNYVGNYSSGDQRLFKDWANHKLTIVGIYIADDVKSEKKVIQLVGEECNAESLMEVLSGVDTLVSYNGRSKPAGRKGYIGFDFPVINAQLGIMLDEEFPHIDLCPLCWEKGLWGGLKKVEVILGIERETEGMDGREAMLQWREYEETGNPDILNALLLYNYEDIVNLEKLMYLLLREPTNPIPPPFVPRYREPVTPPVTSREGQS